jgi:predicted amidohydrolase
MKKAGETNDLTTLNVIGSSALVRPDGRVAILLDTRERGPIAFEVNQQAIDALRLAIGAAETHLRHSKDQSRN